MHKIDLRLGDFKVALADVDQADALILDGPYGSGTHEATNDHIAGSELPDGVDRMEIDYKPWTADDVNDAIDFFAPRIRGWMGCFTSDDLIPAYKDAYRRVGRYPFAPVPIIQPRPRLLGDGPASWAVYLMVARPMNREFATWGCLDGYYKSHTDRTGIVAGAKPLSLMRPIVRDYTRPGDHVVDGCAGGATTLLAAVLEGRRATGSEKSEATYLKAMKRIARYPTHPDARQPGLFDPPLQLAGHDYEGRCIFCGDKACGNGCRT